MATKVVAGIKVFDVPNTIVQTIMSKGGKELSPYEYGYRHGDLLLLVYNVTNNPMPEILQEMGNNRATFKMYFVTEESQWAFVKKTVIPHSMARNGGLSDGFFSTPLLRLFKIDEEYAQELATQ